MAHGECWHVTRGYEPVLRQIDLSLATVFNHPRIAVWRSLSDRENCTLDAHLRDGRPFRLHLKRYPARRWGKSPARVEAEAIELLKSRQIDTVPLVVWGEDAKGRSCIVVEDLAGFGPADMLLSTGLAFSRILEPTAELAARLHQVGLHHRDLYLNHFFVRSYGEGVELRLIDCARVRELPVLFRQRWIVKDLAQFWYSTLPQPISDEQRMQWLRHYAARRHVEMEPLRKAIERKVKTIARHDAKLKQAQPHRNVPIPS